MALTLPRADQSYAEQRRAPRVEVSFRAALLRGGKTVRVHVVDISPLGLCARWERCDTAGMVQIKLPAIGCVTARVAWALGGRIGVEFVHPIAPDAYQELLAAAPNQTPWHD